MRHTDAKTAPRDDGREKRTNVTAPRSQELAQLSVLGLRGSPSPHPRPRPESHAHAWPARAGACRGPHAPHPQAPARQPTSSTPRVASADLVSHIGGTAWCSATAAHRASHPHAADCPQLHPLQSLCTPDAPRPNTAEPWPATASPAARMPSCPLPSVVRPASRRRASAPGRHPPVAPAAARAGHPPHLLIARTAHPCPAAST